MKKNKLFRKKEKFLFSICVPVYNGAKVIIPTLNSILSQSYKKIEVIIVNDRSKDNTGEVIKKIKDKRIKYFENIVNLGYSKNIEECRKKAKGDIVYLMGQDDILADGALMDTYNAFMISENIGAVTRPYFWFDENIRVPVRAKSPMNLNKDEIVTINDNFEKIILMLHTLDQLSGLAYRRKYIDMSFHEDVFPCHVYPFFSIFKKYKVVFLKDYNIAVRISTSQTRSLSSIYCKSPMRSWKEMFDNLLPEKKYKKLRNYLIKNFVAKNYVGLVQIRNYAHPGYFYREVYYLLKYRWQNIFELNFWFYTVGCFIIPPSLLIPLVDWYKNNIHAKRLPSIKFKYSLGEVIR